MLNPYESPQHSGSERDPQQPRPDHWRMVVGVTLVAVITTLSFIAVIVWLGVFLLSGARWDEPPP